MNVVVTGGAGFIGTNLVQRLMRDPDHQVVNIDKLSYASNKNHLKATGDRYRFVQQDLSQFDGLYQLLADNQADVIFHLAAETHVDRSIEFPFDFVQSNILATQKLLEAAQRYVDGLDVTDRDRFRFIHVTTDEVFGSLGPEDPPFQEDSNYSPNSPYSASKAASDHLVRAWNKTYGLPTVTSYCSNNYGPHQFPEKFIPVVISRCLQGKEIPVYGDGQNVRDWIHVDDHCQALMVIAERGKVGDKYLVGSKNEIVNIELVKDICRILDKAEPRTSGLHYKELISFVDDRPGHDFRYAINPAKIESELDWSPRIDFQNGLKNTIHWYLENRSWLLAEN